MKFSHYVFALILLIETFSSARIARAENALVFQQMAYGNWIIYDETGKADGIFPALMRAIADHAEIQLEFHNVPFKRTNKEVSNGKQVLTGYMVGEPFEQAAFNNHVVIAPMLPPVQFGVVMRKGLPARTLKDLAGRHVTFFSGATDQAGLTDNPAIEISMANNLQQALRMLLAGRVDGIWTDYITLESEIEKRLANGLLTEDPSGDRIFCRSGVPAIVVHRDFVSDWRVQRIARSAKILNQQGKLDSIARQWLIAQPDSP